MKSDYDILDNMLNGRKPETDAEECRLLKMKCEMHCKKIAEAAEKMTTVEVKK